tara:strand:- start:7387 stop:8502 length:1116 start_codon:yes stop_codon:yes gene_type:complete
MTHDPAKSRRFLILLLAIATLLLALIVAPFIGGLFSAAVFATVLYPTYAKLAAKLGDRGRLAAILLTAAVTVMVIAPVTVATVLTVQAVAVKTDALVTVATDEGLLGLIQQLPEGLQSTARNAAELFSVDLEGQQPTDSGEGSESNDKPAPAGRFTGAFQAAATIVQHLLAGLTTLVFELGIVVLALFFFLAEGRNLVQWIGAAAPLSSEHYQRFVEEFQDVTVGVFISTVASAALQTGLAAIGYVVVGAPMLVVLIMVTFVAAFIPAIGGATVVVVTGALIALGGELGWGCGLVAWGLLPVALSDNIAKPLMAQGRVRLPTSVIFFAMLGGLVVLGPMGVVGGPLIASFFVVVTRTLAQTEDSDVAEQPA